MPPASPLISRPAPARRGSVYVLALGASTLVVVAGLSVIAITRAQGRAADAQRDALEAGLAARSGIEIAAASTSSLPDWRTTIGNASSVGPLTIGRARVTLSFIDEADANLANDPTQPVRVTAVARAGGATRALSARLVPAGGLGLDCLRASVVTGGSLTITGTTSISAGLLMCSTTLTNSAQLTTDIEAKAVSSTGFINGRVTTNAPTQALPSDTVWASYFARATPIPFNSLANGRIDSVLLSPTTNPYGVSNPAGLYSVSVPRNRSLQIRRSRIQATLLVSMETNATLELVNELNWEPPNSTAPMLLVSGAGSSSVTLNTSASPLSESTLGVNFNPPAAPRSGQSNTTLTDTYPSELRGIIHVVTTATPISVQGSTRFSGCIIAAGAASISGTPSLAPLPALIVSPPTGYTRSTGITMQVEPGSHQWVVDLALTR